MNALDWINAQIFAFANALAILIPLAAAVTSARWAAARRWPRMAGYGLGAAGFLATMSVGYFTSRWFGFPTWMAGFG